MSSIKDAYNIYNGLLKTKARGKDLSHEELMYIQKMDELHYMCEFRPDWYPKQHKIQKVKELQKEFKMAVLSNLKYGCFFK